MSGAYDYVIHKDAKFGFLNLIDVAKIRDSVTEDWFNQTLCQVNDCVVRLGVVKGEFHWHHHDKEDEFFYVVSGKLFIDLEDRTVELEPNQGFTIPHVSTPGENCSLMAPENCTLCLCSFLVRYSSGG